MNRIIKKVAVLGSGVMGSRIACHFANIGCSAYLLDIAPNKLTEDETKKGLTLESPEVRNRIVNTNLQNVLKQKPESLYDESYSSRITTGNFEDNLNWLSECDWIIEAVIENLEIKKSVFEKVEKFRKEGTLITSNTSGIPIQSMLEGRSEDFKQHFCGVHFFNPPRYLPLMEIIPTNKTKKKITRLLVKSWSFY